MKKIIAILLSLALLLGCAAGLAESAEKQNFGTLRINGEFTLKGILPEGYRIIPFEQDDSALLTRIVSDDPTRPEMMLSIAFDETYADVERLNDLDVEALEVLEKTFTDTDPYADISYDETAYGTRLLICRITGVNYDYLDIFSIYKGYFVEFVMTPGKGAPVQKLTEEEVATCNYFLSELDFVAGIEAQELKTAGQTLDAKITGFDPEARTIDVTLLTPVRMTEWQAVSINEGDTIRIGTEEVEISTLVYEGDDAVINDEYYLRKGDDGMYTASSYEMPIMEEAKTLTLTVPDSLVFMEGVDAASGEMLEEEKPLTADEFFAALAAAQQGDIGFDTQNVRITFDGNSEPVQVERYYTPWQ